MHAPSSDEASASVRPWWVSPCRLLWKVFVALGMVVLAPLGVNVLSTWLTSSKGIIPADSPFAEIVAHWQLTLTVSGWLFLLALLTFALSRWPAIPAAPPSSLQTQQNRTYMLQRLRYSYDELMAQSLQGFAWLELGLAHRPDAVQNAATLLLRQSNQPERVLPSGTSIVQVYEEAKQELLILGEPGTGKSTLLLQLAQHLVGQADQDVTKPLPVIIPLSSWAVKRPPMEDWLSEQLSLVYDVPRQVSRQWVREEQVLPLLDGLDEMEESARAACIGVLNTYHGEHLRPLVVCSRIVEYTSAASSERFVLHSAVVMQPLTPVQVDAYLVQAGKPLAALRAALKKNLLLQTLATTPLLLQVLMLTYQGMSVRELPNREAQLRQQIWADYIQRMVERKGDARRYPLHTTGAWLSWLAREMQKHNQTIFFLEQIQPDWLPKRQRFFYPWSIGLIFGLVFGLPGWLLVAPLAGLVFGSVIGSLFGLLVKREGKIKPVEVLARSWKGPLIGMAGGLVIGTVIGPLLGLLFDLLFGGTHVMLVRGLIGGLVFGVVVGPVVGLVRGLAGAFSEKKLAKGPSLSPNEGMQRSAKNGLLLGLVGGLVIGLGGGLLVGLFYGPLAGLIGVLLFWLVCGPIIGLIGGLFAVVEHYTLRFWLARSGVFPWRAGPFLKDATVRILLRRVGGGYSFAHRLLLDFFADAYAGASSASPAAQSILPSPP